MFSFLYIVLKASPKNLYKQLYSQRVKILQRLENETQTDGTVSSVVLETSTPKSPPPFNLTVMKNLAYNVYSRQFLQWALFKSEKAKILLDWSRDTMTPDEHYWSMLDLMKEAPGRTGKITENPLHPYIIWIASKQSCSGVLYFCSGMLGFSWVMLGIARFDWVRSASAKHDMLLHL